MPMNRTDSVNHGSSMCHSHWIGFWVIGTYPVFGKMFSL
jgi:hypothetical protein